MYYTTFFRCRQCFCKVVLAANYEPQATKSFLIQQFFKNVGEVWASSPHLRSKSNFQMKCNKNLRENRKESQLPFQSRGCNENTRFQGQLRSQGKLGMYPSLAEPDSSGIPRRTSLRKTNLQRPAKGGSTPAFACQRLVPSSQQYYPLPSQKNRHRNFFRFHDGFSSTLLLLLIHIEETEPSRISCKMFIQRCPI